MAIILNLLNTVLVVTTSSGIAYALEVGDRYIKHLDGTEQICFPRSTGVNDFWKSDLHEKHSILSLELAQLYSFTQNVSKEGKPPIISLPDWAPKKKMRSRSNVPSAIIITDVQKELIKEFSEHQRSSLIKNLEVHNQNLYRQITESFTKTVELCKGEYNVFKHFTEQALYNVQKSATKLSELYLEITDPTKTNENYALNTQLYNTYEKVGAEHLANIENIKKQNFQALQIIKSRYNQHISVYRQSSISIHNTYITREFKLQREYSKRERTIERQKKTTIKIFPSKDGRDYKVVEMKPEYSQSYRNRGIDAVDHQNASITTKTESVAKSEKDLATSQFGSNQDNLQNYRNNENIIHPKYNNNRNYHRPTYFRPMKYPSNISRFNH